MFLKPGFRDEFEDNLKNFIDTWVRNLILYGDEALDVPVLDPLVLEKFDIDLNQEGLV